MNPAVRRIGATYRLQIREVGFAGATALVPYLVALGIETLYLSPIFTARPGSTHGYDITDPDAIDPALGGAAGLEGLLRALDEVGMNAVIDVVPNHLAIDPTNAYFEGALREGPSGSRGAMFDVDWSDADGKIVLTVLDRPLADALASEAVTLDPSGGAITAPGRSYPIAHPVLVERAHAPEIVAEVLDAQHYRLAYWRLRTSELNYRRFFEIDELIALRQEDPAVYRTTHALTLALAADRRIGGLRIDHVDGLTDPAGYLRRLADDLTAAAVCPPAVLVEKIVAHDEAVPRWPIEGTTGYEFAHLVVGLFVDGDGAATLAEEYRVRSGDPRSFLDRQWEGKRQALDELFPAQLAKAAQLFESVIATTYPGSDIAAADLVEALAEIICALPIYRTYGVGSVPMSRPDVATIAATLRRIRPLADPEVTRAAALLATVLTGGVDPPSRTFADARRRFQQLSSAVMAKGSEDTALFDPGTPLVGAEVGGRPDAPAVTVTEFHEAMAHRLRRPDGLNATSTHDTKRSEDVRTRLAVLTEEPSQWLLSIDRWRRAHESLRGRCDTVDEIYLYETIVGLATPGGSTVPAFRHRVGDHLEKAAREAKRRTTWSDPDHAYEHDLRALVDGVLAKRNVAFHRDLERILARIVPAAEANALGVAVIKIAAPGVPDVYQGTEGAIASLTDPDNRRAVPFDALERALGRIGRLRRTGGPLPAGTAAVPDFRKLAVTAAALDARRTDPELFDRGRYVPLDAVGDHGYHALAFARIRGGRSAIALVTRHSARLPFSNGRVSRRTWGDTHLAVPSSLEGRYVDALSGAAVTIEESVRVADVLGTLPVALLIRAASGREALGR